MSEHNIDTLGKALITPLIVATAYSKAIFIVREQEDLGGTLKSSQFAEMLIKLSMDSEMSDAVRCGFWR
jgi:hypothetical protein